METQSSTSYFKMNDHWCLLSFRCFSLVLKGEGVFSILFSLLSLRNWKIKSNHSFPGLFISHIAFAIDPEHAKQNCCWVRKLWASVEIKLCSPKPLNTTMVNWIPPLVCSPKTLNTASHFPSLQAPCPYHPGSSQVCPSLYNRPGSSAFPSMPASFPHLAALLQLPLPLLLHMERSSPILSKTFFLSSSKSWLQTT